jgi:hypothetical protein
MNIDAKAREIAFSGHTTDEAYSDLIRAALLAARNEALEEAAKKADEYGIGYSAQIATAIRALKGEET